MNEAAKKLTEEIKAKMTEILQSAEIREFGEKTKAATDAGSFEVVISTADFDRQGESIDQNGWDLTHYKTNPVVLWGHDYWSLPIGIADEIETRDGNLVAKGRFAPEEANPFAQQVRRLYDLKIVRATSVGFIAREMQGSVIVKAELLEFSFVPVPANPFALSLSKAQELGLDTAMLATKGIEIKIEDEKPKETEEKKTKPEICEPDSENYDPEACAAIFCDPQSPDYNQEFCDLMKAHEAEKAKAGAEQKKDAEQIGAELSAMQSEIDNAVIVHSKRIIEIVQSEYGAGEEGKAKIAEVLKTVQFNQAIELLKKAIAAFEGLIPKGGEGEEQRGDGAAPKQRSDSAGVDAAIKELDEYLMARQLLSSISTELSVALERMNKKIRERRNAKR